MDTMRNGKKNWLNEVHDATTKVGDVSDALDELAVAFERTGNATLANVLWEHSHELNIALIRIRDTVRQEVSDNFQQAQESVAVNLKALRAPESK